LIRGGFKGSISLISETSGICKVFCFSEKEVRNETFRIDMANSHVSSNTDVCIYLCFKTPPSPKLNHIHATRCNTLQNPNPLSHLHILNRNEIQRMNYWTVERHVWTVHMYQNLWLFAFSFWS
jgi:hypothetical protein